MTEKEKRALWERVAAAENAQKVAEFDRDRAREECERLRQMIADFQRQAEEAATARFDAAADRIEAENAAAEYHAAWQDAEGRCREYEAAALNTTGYSARVSKGRKP